MKNSTWAALLDQLDSPLWIVTASAERRRGGLVATFVNPASIVPDLPRMVVGLARQHHTWELVQASGCFALHLLSEAQVDWVWRFGLPSGRDADKLAGLRVQTGETGSPILPDAAAWLDCRVEAWMETGDRTVYLAEVVASEHRLSGPFLTQQRMALASAEQRALLKQQREKDAATDATAVLAWRAGRR